ncbi:MAG TPA: YjbQ family protein [Bacteroidetes bacterium]|nr:YjbQ family protein [Bacteroidota bacterium]
MKMTNSTIEINTRGFTDIHDITGKIQSQLAQSQIKDGLITLFIPGSTGAITTIEYESGLLKDLPDFLEKIIPQNKSYHHDKTWGDGNGYAHLRASLLGPSLSVPVQNGKMILGTWQQIIFIDFDNRSRQRRIVVQIIG